MELAGTTLTVFFEDPFWVGIWERSESGTYAVSRVVFGAEPSDAQVYDLILTRWNRLRFSPAHPAEEAAARGSTPKGCSARPSGSCARTGWAPKPSRP